LPVPTIDMLRRLASGITPDGLRPRKASKPFESLSFTELFADASRPVRASGRPVHSAADIETEFDDELLEKIGFALDRAEAQGLENILAITGSGVLMVDVHERTIRSAEAAPGEDLLTGIDGAVVLGGIRSDGEAESDAGPTSEEVARGLRRLGSASLMRVLAQNTQ